NRRGPVALGRIGEKNLARAEKLREIMGRKSDAALRQIETERMAHRSAQPWIGTRIGRPHALDKTADHDSIDAGKPCFQRTVNADAIAGRSWTAHPPVRDRDAEQLRIIFGSDGERLDFFYDIVKRRSKRDAIRADKRRSGRVGARPPDSLAMACCEACEILVA